MTMCVFTEASVNEELSKKKSKKKLSPVRFCSEPFTFHYIYSERYNIYIMFFPSLNFLGFLDHFGSV